MEAEKILVVDDNKEIVYSISELLKYEGYETLKAYEDGMEAPDIMERENVDPILLMMMPRLQRSVGTGWLVVEKKQIPVIILSENTVMVHIRHIREKWRLMRRSQDM